MRFNNKGAALIVVIIAMTMMAVLGAAIYRLTTTASFSELLANNNDQAYRLAVSGVRYCSTNSNCAVTPTLYVPDANHIITLAMSGNALTSTGIVNPGTFLESRRVIRISDMSQIWGKPASLAGVISSAGDMSSFGDPITSGSNSSVSSNQATQTISLGGNVTNGAGSLWYTGSSSAANCTAGVCSFNIGMRVYFEFTFPEDNDIDSKKYADGFTFAIISALTNTLGLTGGAPAENSMGELLGFAGPGNTADKLGLKPPKIAIEFDTYPNSGTGNVCLTGNRNDHEVGNRKNNHVALMFWGDDATTNTCTYSGVSYPKKSFDDNTHGAVGTDTEHGPFNSSYTDSGYYNGPASPFPCKNPINGYCNWMEDGHTYSFRLEIIRPTTATGNYVFSVWIYPLVDIAGFINQFQDVTLPFTDTAPHIIRTVSFTAAQHAKLDKIFFGFTEATGTATQQIEVRNMKFFFPTP